MGIIVREALVPKQTLPKSDLQPIGRNGLGNSRDGFFGRCTSCFQHWVCRLQSHRRSLQADKDQGAGREDVPSVTDRACVSPLNRP
jgi:hypothetical protein